MAGLFINGLIVALVAWITYSLLSHEDENLYPKLLRGKNVLLTGASSGIGEEAAYYYAKLGANVVFAARREPLLKKVLARCQELSPSGKFKYVVADFSDKKMPQKVVGEAVSFLGSLDFLILNHAYLLTTQKEITAWKGTEDDHQRLKHSFDVNFLSYVKTADISMPYLKATNGSICVISSMIILTPAYSLPYATSKSAMSMFFTGLRQELKRGGANVSVTIIHLGLILTENAKLSTKSMSSAIGEDLEEQIKVLPVTSPEKGAVHIVQAVARRETEVYYPYNQRLWQARILMILSKDGDAFEAPMRRLLSFVVQIKNIFSYIF